MDENTQTPNPFVVSDPKVISKTIVVEYSVGSYTGPEPPADGVYEKNVPNQAIPDPGYTPSGDGYTFEGLIGQLYRDSSNTKTEDYALFIYNVDKTNGIYSLRVERVDESAPWDDNLKIAVAFHFKDSTVS